MVRQKEKATFNFSVSLLSVVDSLKKELSKVDTYCFYENHYHLKIYFSSQDLEVDLNDFLFSMKREIGVSFDKESLVLRILAKQLEECLEDAFISISSISFFGNATIKHTEIQLEKWEEYIAKKNKKPCKIYLDVTCYNGKKIKKIVDSIGFSEDGYLIDERNNNKELFNSLLLKKETSLLDIYTLDEKDWKQLVLKEKITTKELASLFEVKETEVMKRRKQFLPSVKSYYDEYVFYEVMLYHMTSDDYFSNFSIPLLEQMLEKNIHVIYSYETNHYHELFSVEEELKRQKEIEKNNLLGEEYVMPLSGILLKKLYQAVKKKMIDRKILKNNFFATYYNSDILSSFIHHIENSSILEMYETGEVYQSSRFKTYQELYQILGLNLSLEEKKNLTLVLTLKSVSKTSKKRKRVFCPPRDYVKLDKIKKEVGKTGEELVYDYEWEQLKEYPELQKKIEKTYLIDDAAGYDIKSYDFDGNEILIEVKTSKTSGKDQIHFLISANEDKVLTENQNAYLYYVFDLDEPKLRVISQQMYLSFKKSPTQFVVSEIVCEEEEEK